jgi:hypothetical protein
MKFGLSLLLIVLLFLSITYHAYFVWKRRLYKLLLVQLSIAAVAAAIGVSAVYDVPYPSVAKLLNLLSPLGQERGGGLS